MLKNNQKRKLFQKKMRLNQIIGKKVKRTKANPHHISEQGSKILERITDAFYAIDNQWRFTYINKQAAKFIRGKEQELIGTSILQAFPTLIGSEVEKNFQKAFTEQVAVHFETPSNVFPGIWFDMHVYPSVDGISVYFRDISEKKKIQQQLFEAQKLEAIGQLAGGLAHDLNNQLTIIMGYTDLRLYQLTPDSPFYKDFKQIKKAVEKSVTLTRQLLMFSRKQPLNKEPININTKLMELQTMLEKLTEDGIKLHYYLAPDIWSINADATNIDQIIINLIINARDSMPDGGVITFLTENMIIHKSHHKKNYEIPPGKYVALTVKDSGIGMAEQIIPHIFEPFFTTKEKSKGTGLGLSVVYGIVKAHEGWINVESRVGEGSSFTILFPAIFEKPLEKVTNIIPELPYEQYRGQNEKILLIEDEIEIEKIIQQFLTKHGYKVFACGSIKEAQELYQREIKFDLILSDIILPDGRGTDFVLELLKKEPLIKVLLISGYSDDRITLEKIRNKGFPFLSKPFSIGELFKQIYELLYDSNY